MNPGKLLGIAVFFTVLFLLCVIYTYGVGASVSSNICMVLSVFLAVIFYKNFFSERKNRRALERGKGRPVDLDGDEE